MKGITGAGHLDVAAVASRLPVIRRYTGLPVAVGFGIRDAASAQAVAGVADAVVIGSRIIQEMEAAPHGRAVQAPNDSSAAFASRRQSAGYVPPSPVKPPNTHRPARAAADGRSVAI